MKSDEDSNDINTENTKKNKVPNFMIFIVFLTGLTLLLFPTLSDFYNQYSNYNTIQSYEQELGNTIKMQQQQLVEEALSYNENLNGRIGDITNDSKLMESYYKALDLGDGMIGYIEIDKIKVLLPIYHGTEESILQNAVGHVVGSYLPTGEIGNHTVLTGHTGLPNATLFSNLDQLKVGDTFNITILDDTFYYEVREIKIEEPEDLEFKVDKNNDVVTLVTCIPYGINSHRLLVEAEQIEKSAKDLENEFLQKQNETYALVQGGLIGLIIGVIVGIIIGIGFTLLTVRLIGKHKE